MSSHQSRRSTPPALRVRVEESKSKCRYRAQEHVVLQQLDQARAQLQAAKDQRQFLLVRANVLCDLISTQDCVIELLKKHWSWLYGTVVDELAASAASAAGPGNSRQSTSYRNQYKQHTCVRQVDAATPEQVQQVLAMTVDDWVETFRYSVREFMVLLELVNRPPELYLEDPTAFDTAAAVAATFAANTAAPATATAAAQAAAALPGGTQLVWTDAADSAASSTASRYPLAAAAAAYCADTTDYQLPWERDPMRLLVEALCRIGVKCHVAVLHANIGIMQAGSMNLETRQYGAPPQAFWVSVVQRLHLSPEQALHFKIAANEHTRLTRAAIAAGVDLVQRTKSFSLSAAAEAFAQGKSPEQAAAAVAGRRAGCADRSSSAPAPATGEGDDPGHSSFETLDDKLRRHVHNYHLNIYMINTFLANCLTPYQHAVMWTASYPYTPIMESMAAALESFPDIAACNREKWPLPAHVEQRLAAAVSQHMSQRTAIMQQQKQELWWWQQ